MSSRKLHIIVQAGGLGTRLKHLSRNKPKCLVSVRGKPLLYHLFDAFPEADFTVIGDHLFHILELYTEINRPKVQFNLLKAGERGTAAGIAQALGQLPRDSQALICWSDLLIQNLTIPKNCDKPVVFTTGNFPCRWRLNGDGNLEEHAQSNQGVLGVFFVPNVSAFPAPPECGEFVRWWSEEIKEFAVSNLTEVEDFGELENVTNANESFGFSRFFNKVEVNGRLVTKRVVDPDFDEVHQNEVRWYKEATSLGFQNIPKIESLLPLTMERIVGQHPFEIVNHEPGCSRKILSTILESLHNLHALGSKKSEVKELRSVYIEKTWSRVNSVSKIIPEFDKDEIIVNGILCKNPFTQSNGGMFDSIFPNIIVDRFYPIHGDPTFSNTMISEDGSIKFIDPRGSFAEPGIYGDKWYDIAKVYYSAAAGYDAFNRRQFLLKVCPGEIDVEVQENSFSLIASSIFKDAFPGELARIEILTGLIWLGLTGYARDDVDSIIGSFALGILWLERGMSAL